MKNKILTLIMATAPSLAVPATIPNVPPLVSTSAFANVMIDMSVETPMGGAAYADQKDNPPGCTGRQTVSGHDVGTCYFPSYEYLGIFDPTKCYSYSSDHFEPDGKANNHQCDSGKWSGNFLNWATMTAIDMFIWAMTGGNRYKDDTHETILERARAHDYEGWYPVKYVADPTGAAPFSGPLYITNHNAGGYRFKAGSTYNGNNYGTYNVRVKVCDPDQGLEPNCTAYSSGGTTVYKPVGLIQRYADKMKFGVFAYTNDNQQSRDGGVLRAPMHYVGGKKMDDTGSLVTNSESEFDPDTGILFPNPLNHSSGKSGVINYINRFHYDGYKSYDPISEMFYEVVRYFKHLGRTPEYADGAPHGSYPIYTDWNDPIQFRCEKSFVVAINDANPWLDKKLPGTFFTCDKAGDVGMPSSFTANDCGEPSNPDTSIDVSALTSAVGEMEGLNNADWTNDPSTGEDTVGYVYGLGDQAGNCSGSKHVTDLSQVMGTCPYTPKQNSYYIAGLAYYANTTDLRSDLPGKQTLNSFFIDTQEYNAHPLDGNHNMLYLAGKYGGFTDLNNNGKPDLKAEWDANDDGQPDNYVYASLPQKLITGLEKAFQNILNKSGSLSNVSANSTQITSDTLVFQAIFNSGNWSGNLFAYQVSSTGVATTPYWDAASKLPNHSTRKIFVNDNNNVVPFEWSNLSSSLKSLLKSEDVVDYLRGDRTNEAQNGGTFRNRGIYVLGDIIHSSPFYVKETNTVYIGANDGMLHAFSAGGSTSTSPGEELFAYIPSALTGKLGELTEVAYSHDYYVDGEITVSNPTQSGAHYLVALLGRGGKGLFALDVTNPESFDAGSFLWEYFPTDDQDLGYMVGKPVITKTNDGSDAVIVANGYNSQSGGAVLYVMKLSDGTVIKKIPTGAVGSNGLSSPGILDQDGNGTADYVYAGDLKGNLWKFDISSSDPTAWSAQALFQAVDGDGQAQPITGPVTLAYDTNAGSQTYGKLFIFFGTGSYIFSTDASDDSTQSWYGIIDDGNPITGRAELKERAISNSATVAGYNVRTFENQAANDMVGMKGWYMDLPSGERMVSGSELYQLSQPVLVATSILPESNPCSSGGTGYLNAIDPFTGASTSFVVFDLNDDNKFNSSDMLGSEIVGSVDLDIGMPGAPVLVGNRLVAGGSSGKVASIRVNLGGAATTGRLMWREIIRE